MGYNVASAIAAKRQQRRQNEMNMEMAQYQNSINLEQWQRENDYNTPTSQMERLKAAGVNPRIWWSNGSNVAASSPNLSAPEQQYNAVGGEIAKGVGDAYGSAINAVNQMNQVRMQEEQMKLIQAQIGYYGSMQHLNDVNSNLRATESLMKNIDLNYYDLTTKQRIYGKQLALNNQLASYLNNYGPNSLMTNNAGLLSVDLNSPIFKETPMTTLQRRNIAANIALADAKAIESMWASKAKEKGLAWLDQRIYSERLKQGLTSALTGLTYHKRSNEITRGELMRAQSDVQRMQLDFLRQTTERKRLENANYLPGLGDISDYFRFAQPLIYR